MKRFIEYLVEGALKISGSITSITILLIIIFLFKEGSGLFKNPVVEEGYVLTVNRDNPVEHITSFQIKEIYDENITNWKELGGIDSPILVFRFGDLENYFSPEELGQEYENIPQCLNTLINREKNIIAFFPELYLPKDFSGKQIAKEKISPVDFFGGKEWYPTAQPAAQFGLIPLLLGTLWVSIGAILLALPFGISVAIYMAELASKQMRSILKPLIELLAGIPSVVFGFFGLVVIVPLVQKTFNLPVGETALSGSIVLAIMALPTIITVAEDALKNTPRAMKEASLALGATQWQTIYKVVIPYSISGITSAIVLGVGRAVGETMAVLMVTGNAAIIPHTLLEPVRTIPATIAAELGEAPSGGAHYQALFALGAILFLITLILSISVEYISNKKNK
ncbi:MULTISPECIES: phosphate ABC transporter permease subunit PstC [Bacteroidales]|mgnify:FL=1|uniref:Phosphate transport system permease protein n=1 Tax=Coprobacter secundus subsp. similis TaxID=2751153 RepID=A0A7G1HVE6_9BACT|nr:MULTISPECIES: phosphate ABC transporter permease subunit PstC [Bacteroidales]BCI63520.1 phosphate transport system permease protein [Coprobacter secundus subsp. similis]